MFDLPKELRNLPGFAFFLVFCGEGCVETPQHLPGSLGATEAGEGLFGRNCSDRRRGSGFKLKMGKFRLDIKKKIFPRRVVTH